MHFLVHWSDFELGGLIFASGCAVATRDWHRSRRRARRFVRRVPPGRGNARLARENARFRTGVPR
jgi:hypothetical protein